MKIKKKLAILWLRTKINLLAIVDVRLAGKEAFKVFCTPFPPAINNKKTIFDTGKTLEFTLNDTLVKGYQFNHPREKKLLILHGFSSSSKNFHSYVSAFIDKDYEVFAFDAPAHGGSEGKTINALLYSKAIEKINDLYGPFTGYMAHSLGGLAVSLALENIPNDANTKLVLIAPATETLSAIDDALRILGIKNNKIRVALEEEILSVGGKPAGWYSIRRAFNTIQAQTLWIHDEEDDTTPVKDALKVKDDAHAHVQFMITQGLGHRKIYRDEAVKKAIVDFL